MKKYICFLLIISFLFLASCSAKSASASEIFYTVYEKLSPVSYGEIYFSNQDKGTKHYMSSALFSTVYGDGVPLAEADLIEEYAIYLSSFALPCEIAVFKCYSPSDTPKIEQMCIRRLDFLKKHFKNTEYENILDTASVISSGKYVIMIISDTSESLSEISKSALN